MHSKVLSFGEDLGEVNPARISKKSRVVIVLKPRLHTRPTLARE